MHEHRRKEEEEEEEGACKQNEGMDGNQKQMEHKREKMLN